MERRQVAVIGAGASGICSAKYLIQAGHDVTVYESGSYIGGLWVYDNDGGGGIAYKSLHINSEKRVTQFHDFPFAEDVQDFPSHEDMHAYLHSYAESFGVLARVQFKSRVTAVRPMTALDGDEPRLRWQVEIENGTSAGFDSVVVAPGHQSHPSLPAFAADFTGECLHAHTYREPSPYQDKRVLIVGSGNSGCDITADICVLAKRTVMVARSPELIVPKLFMGKPVTQIIGLFDRPWLPAGLPQRVRNLITRMEHGQMEQWGFQTPPRGVRTHPTSHATLIQHIAYRRAEVKREVVAVQGQEVTFSDGSREEFDVMICATGYELSLPFLDPQVVQVHERGMELYKQVVSPTWPGLYFLGFSNAAGSSNLRMFELQSQLVSMLESGEGLLPGREDIQRDIEQRRQYIAKHYPPGPRYTLEIEASEYSKAMTEEFRAARARRRSVQDSRPDRRLLLHSRSVEDRISQRLTPSLGVPTETRTVAG